MSSWLGLLRFGPVLGELQLCSGLGTCCCFAGSAEYLCCPLQIISLYTLWQLVHMHEMDGHRFNRYQELGQVRRGVPL